MIRTFLAAALWGVLVADAALLRRRLEGTNCSNVSLVKGIITTAADDPFSVAAADLDGDQDMDAVAASGQAIEWYENNGGASTFTMHTLGTVDGAVSVATADLDGDQDVDVLSASNGDSQSRNQVLIWRATLKIINY